MNNKNYAFEDLKTLIDYIYFASERSDMTALRLQKNLYIMYTYYSGVYSGLVLEPEDGYSEQALHFPYELFDANFLINNYGPFIREVEEYQKTLPENYEGADYQDVSLEDGIIKNFVTGIIAQTDEMGEFTLIELSQDSQVFEDAYAEFERINEGKTENRKPVKLDNAEIRNEFQEKDIMVKFD